MHITLHTIPIRDIVAGFQDNDEMGVVGYGGRLNIRPAYQREYIYDEKQKVALIDSIFKQYPINVMYWVKNTAGTFELLDGQQRTLSICSFHEGEFFVNVGGTLRAFHNLTAQQRDQFLSYELQVYVCEDATDQEKIDWFRIINFQGETLKPQELLNAIYAGPWVTDCKRLFAKTGCVAYKRGERFMAGTAIRQDYLQTVLAWISGGKTEEYMAQHQHDTTADREWQYFQRVVAWVEALFPHYRREMKGVAWGELYNRHKDTPLLASKAEQRVAELMIDDDVTRKSGIYAYILSGDERHLSIRAFTPKMKREAYERQQGICAHCGHHFDLAEMEADHITPWSQGGPTTADNCQMLCRQCNRTKSNK